MSYPTTHDAGHADSGTDRRAYHRFALPHGRLMADLGAEGHMANRAPVQDISRGGVRLRVNEVAAWAGASHCVVRFLDEASRVRPAAIRGKIKRIDDDHGDFFVAIEFAEPLDELAVFA